MIRSRFETRTMMMGMYMCMCMCAEFGMPFHTPLSVCSVRDASIPA